MISWLHDSHWLEVKCAKNHHSLNPATAWWLMGGLQVSTKLCHSNTPVGQVSLNGILNIIILTQADDGGEDVYWCFMIIKKSENKK